MSKRRRYEDPPGVWFTVERLFEPGSEEPNHYEEQWSHKPELMARVLPTLAVRAVV